MSRTMRPRFSQTTFSLPIRPLTRPGPFLILPNTLAQTRHESSTRRHRKKLNIAPAPSMGGPPRSIVTGSSGRSRQPHYSRTPSGGDQIIFNPPPAMPNVYHTPQKFLPASDVRKSLPPAPGSAVEGASTTASSETSLPPPVSPPYTKSYHLTAAEIEEMRRLRLSDENFWTRGKLAEKFKCSHLFVGIVVQASEERVKKAKKEMAAPKKRWGVIKKRAAKERQIRRSKWVEEA